MERWGSIVGVAALLVCSMPYLTTAQQGPCSADLEKFCKDVKPGGGRIIACLKQHEAEVSEACKKAQGTAQARMHSQGPGPACRADLEKFCKDVQPGGGRLMKCLSEHQSELSPECQAQHKHAQ
jgi:hypothetical protein